jgi:lipoprotein-releasing system permease protein
VKGAFKSMKVANVGLFQINESINSSRVYTSLQNAQYLLGLKPHKISAIEIISVPGVDETKIRLALSKIFDDEIVIKSRVQLNAALYKMLNAEHLAVYLIFTLILIIALFNIVGSIIMMILHKKDDLKTLYSIGTTKQEIQNIFFMQGVIMTIIGGLIGLFLGAVVVSLQLCFDLLMITPSLAYPVVLKGSNFAIAFSTILILGLIASRLASWNLKKLQFTDQAN